MNRKLKQKNVYLKNKMNVIYIKINKLTTRMILFLSNISLIFQEVAHSIKVTQYSNRKYTLCNAMAISNKAG